MSDEPKQRELVLKQKSEEKQKAQSQSQDPPGDPAETVETVEDSGENPGHEGEPLREPGNKDLHKKGSFKKGLFKRLFGMLLLLVLLSGIALALGGAWMNQSLTRALGFSDQTFSIESGNTFKDFVAQLQKAEVIKEPYSLRLYARYKRLAGKLHTGYYKFEDGMNLQEVMQAVTSGKYRISHQFTFVPGSTYKQLRQLLRETDSMQQTLGEQSDNELLAALDSAQPYSNPEGLFLPETYAYFPGESDRDILSRAYQAMQSLLDREWAQRAPDLPLKSPYEALILASIIEKETGLAAERALIAGVFVNRLNKGMRLQTDPTVIYGMGENYDGNIRRKDLTTDTPYNTYTRDGLPPTPIAMPGKAAILAVLHPQQSKAIFFVAKGDGSGGHKFSETLTEHNKAVKAYLKARRKGG